MTRAGLPQRRAYPTASDAGVREPARAFACVRARTPSTPRTRSSGSSADVSSVPIATVDAWWQEAGVARRRRYDTTDPATQQFLRDLDKKLWTAADRLRANLDAAVYKHAVLGLIFLKYVSDSFAARQKEPAPILAALAEEEKRRLERDFLQKTAEKRTVPLPQVDSPLLWIDVGRHLKTAGTRRRFTSRSVSPCLALGQRLQTRHGC